VKYCNAACKKKHRTKHKKAYVREEWLSCMTNNCSNNLHYYMEIVQSVSYECQHIVQELDICHVVERQYVVDVFMRLYMMTKGIKLTKNVHFVEFHRLLQMRRY